MRFRFRRSHGCIATGAAFCVVVTLVALTTFRLTGSGAGRGEPVKVVVPPGSSFRVAAESLAHADIIHWPRVFSLYASLSGRDRGVKAGTYLLRRGTGWSEAIEALTLGKGIVHMATIPEGFDLAHIVPLLARTLGVPEDSVRAAASDTATLRRLNVPTPTLEGYLFPDTYSFPDGTPARKAVSVMVDQFEQAWKPEWNARLEQLGMSRHEVMALASIIEKEARLAEERPVISAVYHNRLKAGMLLQADPTVQYALGHHVSRVLYADLDIDSKYNTYKYPGLPPGPVASPGLASIEAALFPASVPYLYFVAHPDGHHEFRTTFAGHEEARQEIRREENRLKRDSAKR